MGQLENYFEQFTGDTEPEKIFDTTLFETLSELSDGTQIWTYFDERDEYFELGYLTYSRWDGAYCLYEITPLGRKMLKQLEEEYEALPWNS